jgi:hypothetical protein
MISSATLYRLSGLALLVGALLSLIVDVAEDLFISIEDPHQVLSASWLTVMLLSTISSVLVVGGLPGILVRQRAQAGWLGLLGFVLTLVSGILLTGLTITRLLVFPYLAATAPQLLTGDSPPVSIIMYTLVAALLVVVGAALLGVATMRAGVFPRWAGLLLIVGVALNLALLVPLPNPIIAGVFDKLADVLVSLGLGWMGFVLLARSEVSLVQPLEAAQVSA